MSSDDYFDSFFEISQKVNECKLVKFHIRHMLTLKYIQSMSKQKILDKFPMVNKFGDLEVNVIYHKYNIIRVNSKTYIATFEIKKEKNI